MKVELDWLKKKVGKTESPATVWFRIGRRIHSTGFCVLCTVFAS